MKTTPVIVLLSILAAWAWAAFEPDRLWPDDRGVPINARGGGLLSYQGVYYWFGEHMADGTTGEVAQGGVHVYSSTNLYHWKDEGIALKVSDDPASDIAAGCVIEGPKVLHNPKTGKFVMWFHLEPKGSGHAAALAGVAVADRPTGPYRYRESFRLNAGKLPRTVTEASQLGGSDGPLIRDLAGGQMSGDMTLFADDDGTAYQIAVSEDNRTLHISRLTEDYLRTSGEYARAFPDAMYRSPVVFKRRGRYWMIASDGAGQAAGATRLATSDSIWGTWTALGNPWVGVDEQVHAGFDARPTDVLPLPGNTDAFIFIADRSQPDDGHEGRYVWLPIQFRADDSPFLQ